ncbi:MAG: cysteine--tRNA ligase [bacterium]
MPDLFFYNTLSRSKERFTPVGDGVVRMYVCGPTVYDVSHVGHARKEVVFDVIARYLRSCGWRLRYVRNVTDVDDKIILRASQEGRDWEEIARRYEAAFREDMGALGILEPDQEPRATETIPEMLDLIEELMAKGYAYCASGSVYFSVGRWGSYGKLSRRRPEEMLAGARVEPDASKRDPLDFALWKASKPGEPSWPSPWGPGRPGWHIECSAMGRKFLGETLDIHGGGMDLIFPHHENEIAQSEAATGKPFCRYWIHNGLLTVNREKMSKSLGNFVTVRDALKRFHPEVLRMFFLSHQYRSPVDFSDEAVGGTRRNLDYFYNTLLRIEEICGRPVPAAVGAAEAGQAAGKVPEGMDAEMADPLTNMLGRFRTALSDDFNTAEALGELFRAATFLNRWIDGSGRAGTPEGRALLHFFRRQLGETGRVLGLFQEEPVRWFRQAGAPAGVAVRTLSDERVEERIQAREAARRSRDWKAADLIRKELAVLGILLEDTPQGTRWKRRS